MQNIFIYGTLLSPEITKKLTGKSFTTSPAVLFGYKRYCVKNSDYPAIIMMKDSNTEGMVIENIDNSSLDVLSFYEGDEYEKKMVTVLSNGKLINAITFVWAQDFDFLAEREWDFHWFRKNKLKYYIEVVIPDTLETIKNG